LKIMSLINLQIEDILLKFETVEETQRAFVTANRELRELGFMIDKTNTTDKHYMLYREINDILYCVWVTSYRKRIEIEIYSFNSKDVALRAPEWGDNNVDAIYMSIYHRIKYRKIIPQVALANSSLWCIERKK
jgi:hypothetical protein